MNVGGVAGGATAAARIRRRDELRERLNDVDPAKPVYVICQSGLRSHIACRILSGNGYEYYNFSGGFRFYDAVMKDRTLVESASECEMDQ